MSPGTQVGEKSVTYTEIIHINQNHFDAIEPINPTNNPQLMMMAVHEQGVVIDESYSFTYFHCFILNSYNVLLY